MNNINFILNKNVLVTGHTGFKGVWLCKLLNRYGANVYGFSLNDIQFKPTYNMFNIANIMNSECFSDIRNISSLKKFINDKSPDIIFHLAAQPLVRDSYAYPKDTFEINSIGTLNLLECLKDYKKPCQVICITTDKVYDNNEYGEAFKETDKLGGYDPYSASKACAELIIDSYRKSFFNPKDYGKTHQIQLASVRAGNVIGGGDFAKDRIIPDIIRAIKDDRLVEIRNPNSIRPWQHVLEPLYGYLKLACEMCENFDEKWSSAWNFGPNDKSFKDVRYIVEKATNKLGLKWKDVSNEYKVHEAQVLKLNIDRTQNELNWTPKLDIEKTLDWTFDWYNVFLNNKDVNEITERQIAEYELL